MTSPSYMPGANDKRRYSFGAVLSAAAAAALLGGAGGVAATLGLADEPAAPATFAAAESTPEPAASTSAAAPADDRRFAMGKVWTFDNGSATTVVLRYRANVDEAQDGEAFNAIEIRSCVSKDADEASRWSDSPWTLEDAEGVSYNSHVNGVIRGEYPFDKLVEPGRCIKGWTVFAMPKGVKPILAVYEGAGNVGRPAEWKIG